MDTPMLTLRELLGVEYPIIQAPMAGSQGSALTIAVSNAGGLGSLACAMLSTDTLRTELATIRAGTPKPFNVNFFCHPSPPSDAKRESAWRATLAPYFAEFDIDAGAVASGASRVPFSRESAEVVEEVR